MSNSAPPQDTQHAAAASDQNPTPAPDRLAHMDRLGTGLPYHFSSPAIQEAVWPRQKLLKEFNESTTYSEIYRTAKDLFGSIGERSMVAPPLVVEWGNHISIGKDCYVGPSAVFQDTGNVTIGDRTLIGPRFTALTVSHPLNPLLRKGLQGPERSRPISIGNDVWIGASVTILPGINVGNGCMIGAGTLLTKSTGPGELWVGSPGRFVRMVEEGQGDEVDWGDVPLMA